MNASLETSAPACSAERTALAVEVLQRSGRLRLRLRGESMLPTLWPGDEVEVASCSAAQIMRGDLALTFSGSRFFLHRVWNCSEKGYVVIRGDAMPAPDPAMPSETVVGKVTRVTRAGQAFLVSRRCTGIRRALGMVFWYSSLARRIALRLHSRRMKRIEIAESRQTSKQLAFYFCNQISEPCNPESR